MKLFVFCVLVGLYCMSCSSDHDKLIPEEPALSELTEVTFSVSSSLLDSIQRVDSISQNYEGQGSRSWISRIDIPAMYLISDIYGKRHSLQIGLSGTGSGVDWIVHFCLSVRNGMVYATYGNKSIPLSKWCMLSTVHKGTAVGLENEKVTTPSGKPADEPYGDRLFRTERFSVGYDTKLGFAGLKYIYNINYNNEIYNNKSGYFQTDGWFPKLLFLDLNRYTTKIKANLVILDWDIFLLGGVLTARHFKDETGTDLSRWTFRTYLTNTPKDYDVINNPYLNGNKIVALMNKPIAMQDGQITWGDGALIYSGIGKVFGYDEGYVHVFPMAIKKAHLCYSFYFNDKGLVRPKYRNHNTLMVPLKNISMEPNVENEITTYFFLEDLVKAMTKVGRGGVSRMLREDSSFGTVMDIPYEVKVKQNIIHE